LHLVGQYKIFECKKIVECRVQQRDKTAAVMPQDDALPLLRSMRSKSDEALFVQWCGISIVSQTVIPVGIVQCVDV